MNNPVNTTFAYPCPKCSHDEQIDFANPHLTHCPSCNEPYPVFQVPVDTILPTPEITLNPQIDSSEGEISSESSEG